MPGSAAAERVPVNPHRQCHYPADITSPSVGPSVGPNVGHGSADYSGRPASRRARFMKTSR